MTIKWEREVADDADVIQYRGFTDIGIQFVVQGRTLSGYKRRRFYAYRVIQNRQLMLVSLSGGHESRALAYLRAELDLTRLFDLGKGPRRPRAEWFETALKMRGHYDGAMDLLRHNAEQYARHIWLARMPQCTCQEPTTSMASADHEPFCAYWAHLAVSPLGAGRTALNVLRRGLIDQAHTQALAMNR